MLEQIFSKHWSGAIPRLPISGIVTNQISLFLCLSPSPILPSPRCPPYNKKTPEFTAQFKGFGIWGHRVCVCVRVQSRPTLWDPVDCNSPGSSVHEISQARLLQWVAISSSRMSSQPRDRTHISCISCTGKWILYHWLHLGNLPVLNAISSHI